MRAPVAKAKGSIVIEGLDKDLVLSIVTEVKIEKKMISLEELNDGTWRLIYSTSVIPDISKVVAFRFRRDDL
jgi:hypothetical protein